MKPYNIQFLEEQLKNVQDRIKENLELQKKYPEDKRGLLIGLKTLKHLEYDITNALKEARS